MIKPQNHDQIKAPAAAQSKRLRPLLWLALALPGLCILNAYVTDAQGYGWTLKVSGQWAVWMLIAGLCISPLRMALKRIKPRYNTGWIARLRRPLGVAMFGYTLLHLAVYLQRKADMSRITEEAFTWELATGWIAFALAVPLVITSTDRAKRRMGKAWLRLHRWVYPVAVLSALHWILTAFDPSTAYGVAAAIALLLGVRVYRRYR